MRAIDFHTHAFPDSLAERAIPSLEEEGDLKAALDGKVSSLLRSMDAAGIAVSVICSIATRPEQFEPILRWSLGVASERIIPFASIHPRDPEPAGKVRAVRDAGLAGIKLHPYYQDFRLDDASLFPLYEEAERLGTILVVHTGYDLAFERVRRADPRRIRFVLDAFPNLRLVTTHLGAWQDWDEVRAQILGRPIYMETSFSVGILEREKAREIIQGHPAEYVLFGSDSPWADQAESLAAIRALDLGPEREARILRENARTLLGLGD